MGVTLSRLSLVLAETSLSEGRCYFVLVVFCLFGTQWDVTARGWALLCPGFLWFLWYLLGHHYQKVGVTLSWSSLVSLALSGTSLPEGRVYFVQPFSSLSGTRWDVIAKR